MSHEQAQAIVSEAYQLCSQLMPVEDCWLYGSYARGDANEESDVDILMTVNVSEDQLRAYRHSLAEINSRLSLAHDVTVSITAKTAESFARRSHYVPYYQNVLREGVRYAG